jgi:hypothetical protein
MVSIMQIRGSWYLPDGDDDNCSWTKFASTALAFQEFDAELSAFPSYHVS